MKRTHFSIVIFIAFTLIGPSLWAGGSEENLSPPVLDVYCYDSFSSEWGPGGAIAEAFKKETGIEVVFHAPGDAVTVLNQLILEGSDTIADVVVGLDESLLERSLNSGILDVYDSPALSELPEDLVFDESRHMLPFDYGHFAVCYDSDSVDDPPTSLEDLTSPRFKDSLILMDPRTSSPGMGFFLWTVAVYGEGWPDYWERLKPSILTISDGWSQGYALFTSGEAPLVLSYGTSPVYHAEYEGSTRYLAAEFTDGHIRQVEGMGVVAGTDNPTEARAFIDFMLGTEAQRVLAMSNIMLPVNPMVELPESFDFAMRPKTTLSLPEADEALVDRWIEVFSR